MDAGSSAEAARLRTYSSERAKAFIDAVVAIAMTLLILPLMESIGDPAERAKGAWTWITHHDGQLISFVLSFVIIAMFWMSHHRLFSAVERVTTGLMWITMGWLLSIVWLPVATAMSGQMPSDDPLVKVLYIGSMILTSLISLGTRVYLLRHPSLYHASSLDVRRGMSADIAMAMLFSASLVLAILVPEVGYFWLFLMTLTRFVQPLFARMLGVPRSRDAAR